MQVSAYAEASKQEAHTLGVQKQLAQLEAQLQEATSQQKAASITLNKCKAQLSQSARYTPFFQLVGTVLVSC